MVPNDSFWMQLKQNVRSAALRWANELFQDLGSRF
jgi:hypothetical protein